jgi:hypothetical protein
MGYTIELVAGLALIYGIVAAWFGLRWYTIVAIALATIELLIGWAFV